MLNLHGLPVLYIDSDCIIESYPDRIDSLVKRGDDFAIYNWLADTETSAFVPTRVRIETPHGVEETENRFYRYSHSIDYFGGKQLICSGAVQFYNASNRAQQLLTEWHSIVMRSPNTPDDQCLDFAFNNRDQSLSNLRTTWLDKSYCRYAWWIFTKPVINHPDIPTPWDNPLNPEHFDGRQRFYPDQLHIRRGSLSGLRDCLIDTEQRLILHISHTGAVATSSLLQPIWL